jgi:hypothetical protein
MANYEVCLALWHQALESDHGIAVEPDDGDLTILKQDLYKAREKARDMRLQELSLFVDPDGKEIWICKGLMNHSRRLL